VRQGLVKLNCNSLLTESDFTIVAVSFCAREKLKLVTANFNPIFYWKSAFQYILYSDFRISRRKV